MTRAPFCRTAFGVWGPKTPFTGSKSPKRGGVPFRPEPFLAIFREKWPKNGQKRLLASIGPAPKRLFGTNFSIWLILLARIFLFGLSFWHEFSFGLIALARIFFGVEAHRPFTQKKAGWRTTCKSRRGYLASKAGGLRPGSFLVPKNNFGTNFFRLVLLARIFVWSYIFGTNFLIWSPPLEICANSYL